ncbi:MAG: aminodeoxychorismate synthase component I [Sulfuricurvum sp.]|nr:aminodeoxychorismate synthase component I [Sulfuricurvum sp.]
MQSARTGQERCIHSNGGSQGAHSLMVEQLTKWISAGIPTFFYTDFKGEKFHCHPLDDLKNQEIEFSFGGDVPRNNSPHKPHHSPLSYKHYIQKFEAVAEHIRAGNTYLLNLTLPTLIETPYSLQEIYAMAHAPYKLRVRDEFVCFSPEPFITIEENTIHTYPMKGTIDASHPNAIETLLNDPKELAEHTMIVDLLRNDLGIVATDIQVEAFRTISTIDTGAKQLLQTSSHISGKLSPAWRENIGDILKSLLPAGSISGTPKKRTVEIIEEIEGYDRGYFTGVFGYFDGKNLYSAVAIRFIENINGTLVYKSGGGITAESDCSKEYQEMIDKIYIP